jgi:enoyl-CoA hydratase/carnithine racemase
VGDPSYRTLKYTKIGYCRIVGLSTALDKGEEEFLFAELAEVCDRIAWDDNARVVLLNFDGAFKSSPGVGRFQNRDPERSSLVEPVAQLKQPVIATIGGDAIGLDLELALACDIRIGIKNARFGFPQIKNGQMPFNGGTQRLPRLIGIARAMDMILTGELIDAEEARRVGLLNRIAASEELVDTAMKLAQNMAEKSPLSMSYVKEALYGSRDLTLDQGLRMELDLYLLLFGTSDRSEGIQAFKEKRTPRFRGN